MTNEFKKLSIDPDKLPISWMKQRVEINEQLTEKPKERFVLIHRWVDIAALAIVCVVAGWLLINHSITPKIDIAAIEEETLVEATLPESLIVLNDFEDTRTDYDEIIDFVVPFDGR